MVGCQPEAAVDDMRVDLVVDDSKSILGFLRVTGGNYRDLLRRLTDRRVTSGLTVRSLNRTSAMVKSSDLLKKEFYRFDDTPLQNAFDHAARGAPNVVTVVVSDLVQSGSDPEKAVRALSAALERAPHVLIIGMSAPYYEDSDQCEPDCDPDTDRHFYLIALASDPRYLRTFMTTTGVERLADRRTAEEIERGIGDGPTLFYSHAPILDASNIEIMARQQSEWQPLHGETTIISCDAGMTHAPFAAFVTRVERTEQAPSLFLRVRARVNAAIADSARIETCVDAVRTPPPTRRPPDVKGVALRGLTPLVSDAGRSTWLELQYDATLPTTNQWTIYRVRSFIKAGPRHVPWWVERWSADDRSKDGTLALESLVREIVKHRADETPVMEIWLGLAYEQLI
jgi:hypothetical protein